MTPGPNGQWSESVLYNFDILSNNDGVYPRGALTMDAAGNIYGVTAQGGQFDCGTVFELSPEGNGNWKETILNSFPGDQGGCLPNGNLIFDSAGNIYGVTEAGGGISSDGGVLYELSFSSGSWHETVLYAFPAVGTKLGTQPEGIIFDSAGNLYGVSWGSFSHGEELQRRLGTTSRLEIWSYRQRADAHRRHGL